MTHEIKTPGNEMENSRKTNATHGNVFFLTEMYFFSHPFLAHSPIDKSIPNEDREFGRRTVDAQVHGMNVFRAKAHLVEEDLDPAWARALILIAHCSYSNQFSV